MDIVTELPGDDIRVYSGCQWEQLPEKSWPGDSSVGTCEWSQNKFWGLNKINRFAQ